MDTTIVTTISNYIIKQGLLALSQNTSETNVEIDYVAIFCKDNTEYQRLAKVAESIGKEVDPQTANTGRTFLLNKPLTTIAGILPLLKIRKPDPIRPQRGAPDFRVTNYQLF